MKRFGITSLLLITVNLVLAGAITVVWKRGERRVAEPASLVVSPLALPDLAALNSIPMPSVDVAGIRGQAVFYASRAFYVAPVTTLQVPQPDYDLNGTLRLPDGKRTAFVKKRGGTVSRTLHVGDDLDGWYVRAIDADRITLDLNGQAAELSSAKVKSVTSGLIRTTSTPRAALAGIHVLSATGTSATLVNGSRPTGQPGRIEARFYLPRSPDPK